MFMYVENCETMLGHLRYQWVGRYAVSGETDKSVYISARSPSSAVCRRSCCRTTPVGVTCANRYVTNGANA